MFKKKKKVLDNGGSCRALLVDFSKTFNCICIMFFSTTKMYIDSQVTKMLKTNAIKQDNTEHKTYIRHISLTVNYVNRLNIKYI